MKAKNDITKLPKWAQEHIAEIEESEKYHSLAASATNCHFENNAVKHDKNTAKAIKSVADALAENAKALKQLAKSIVTSPEDVNFGNGIDIDNRRGKPYE